jgi:RNA polymerase sigma-70 factor (ECF subfamily)
MLGDAEVGARDTTWAPQISDKALVQSVVEGNKPALKILYLRHRARVYRFATRLTGSESIADEVVNEVFLTVWRDAGQFGGKSQVATRLLGIARFKALSHCRRPGRRRIFPLLNEE